MTYDYEPDERCRQITVLLAYPKVGPLSASAIATNLGTSEDEARTTLAALLRDGRIVQTGDGRLTVPSVLGQGRAGASEPVGSQLNILEPGGSA